jgi:hypothetical protein
MIYYVDKNSSKTISRVAINSGGGVVDLAGATIVVTAKQFGNSAVTLFTKSSEDSSEIEIVNNSLGLFLVKLLAADTTSLNFKSIYCNQVIVIGSTTYSDTFFIHLKGVTNGIAISIYPEKGTTAERPVFTIGTHIGYQYYDTDMESPIFWSGTEWT